MWNWLSSIGSKVGSFFAPAASTAASGGSSWIPSAIGALGSIAGAALSYKGAKRQNRINLGEARRRERFQERMVSQKMKYDERLSNTAVQRRMEDMRRAGINPIVAFGLGAHGASSPMAAVMPGAQGHVSNELGQFVNSAMSMQRMYNDVLLSREAVKAARYENVAKRVEAGIDSSLYGKVIRYLNRSGRVSSSAADMIRAIKGTKAMPRHGVYERF
jgi:hypothetical protein